MTKKIGFMRKETHCYILFDSQCSHNITTHFLNFKTPRHFFQATLILSRVIVNVFSLVSTEQGTDSIPSAYNCF